MSSTRSGAVPLAIALMTFLAVTVSAKTASTSINPTPTPTPVASPPAPLPPRPDKPGWEPTGEANATVKRDGLRMELWLSDTVAQPGAWVQAHVRITNAGTRTRFHEAAGPCLGDPFAWHLDLFPLFDPGREWPGLPGVFKRELVARRGPVPDWLRPDEMPGTVTVASAECTGSPEAKVGRLAPGEALDADYATYPEYVLERPLPRGPFTIRASFHDRGGGRTPDRDHVPLVIEATVLMAGPDPGYPSPLVLIDHALAEPSFYRWVTAAPGHVAPTAPHWFAWPPLTTAMEERAPNGYLEIGLFRPGTWTRYRSVFLDPWTGEVL